MLLHNGVSLRRHRRSLCYPLALAVLLAAGCLAGDRIGGNVPEEATPPTPLVTTETFLRRAFTDLHGIVPAAQSPTWQEALALLSNGLTPQARAAVVDLLLGNRAYADAFFAETVGPMFSALGGMDGTYSFLLYYVDELIGMTADPQQREFLSYYRTTLAQEQTALEALPERLHAREIDERELTAQAARSTGALVLSGDQAYARFLFQHLLGREPGQNELTNGVAMAQAAAFAGPTPPVVGIVLRKEGRHLDDLVSIIVDSDAYLEERVRALCLRLLGRYPTPAETWALFAALRDARRAGEFSRGYRALLKTLITSDEYVRQ